ncbi:MAG: ABC-type bacteriocin/lantibiotic exporter with double-glycine peptidase domain [Candidatus Azotimanducaceae bacterium]|jgi:ABC-type bacteriocin/lantibiotic exporter with double-glycine peptidase domain
MFDIAIFAHPAKLKKAFLATTEVAPQSMGEELQREFDQLREESPDIHMSGNFWWDFVQTYKNHLMRLVWGRTVMTGLILIAVLASKRILDTNNSMTAAIWLVVFYALVQLVLKVVNAWTAQLQGQLFICVRTFVTLRVNVKLLRTGQLSGEDFSTGNLKTLVSSDIYRIAELLHGVARNGLPCLLGLLLLGPVIVYYMGWPGVIAIIVAFGAMPLSFLLGKYVHKKEGLIKIEEDTLATIVGEWVTNVRLLRFLGWETLMRHRIAAHIRCLVIEATRQHGVNLINFGISVTWWLFPIVALIWANGAMNDSQEVGTLFASIWMLNHITLYIRFLPDIFISYASASACVDRLSKLFQHRDIHDDLLASTGRVSPSLSPSLSPAKLHFRQVGFHYEHASTEVISNLDLILDLREGVSLIGRVGAGKSTLLKLACAELKPTSGEILVEFSDGTVLGLWHSDVYAKFRESVGYMPQEAYLSNTNLAVNISLNTAYTEAAVMRAIRMAELEADIGYWDSGLTEEVGETGVNLSGGQKQRVNLARALYSNRPYLILDDPLSAVDTDTEGRLMATINECPDGYLLSTHRLTELQQTDRVLVMEAGRIVEDGDPKLLEKDRRSEFSQQLRAGESAPEEIWENEDGT